MRVRMKVAVSGFRDGDPWPAPGGEIVVPDDEGASLCHHGIAEPVAEPVKAEKRPAAKRAEKRNVDPDAD